MSRRIAKAVAVFGSPFYLLPLGPFAIVGIPLLTAVSAEKSGHNTHGGAYLRWDVQPSRRRLGCFSSQFSGSTGSADPTGAWIWVGPLVGLIVYVAGCTRQCDGHGGGRWRSLSPSFPSPLSGCWRWPWACGWSSEKLVRGGHQSGPRPLRLLGAALSVNRGPGDGRRCSGVGRDDGGRRNASRKLRRSNRASV